ncbi:Ras and EF-hand domain-containing protein-like protein, partial [Bienertia sinuspersici]
MLRTPKSRDFKNMTNYIQHASNFCTLKQKHKGQFLCTTSRLSSRDEIQQRRSELRKELLQLDEEDSQTFVSTKRSEDSLKKHVTIVKDLTDSRTSLEKGITIAEEDAMKLEEANKGLKHAHDSLKSFKWS